MTTQIVIASRDAAMLSAIADVFVFAAATKGLYADACPIGSTDGGPRGALIVVAESPTAASLTDPCDVLVATDTGELANALAAGLVVPDRTHLIIAVPAAGSDTVATQDVRTDATSQARRATHINVDELARWYRLPRAELALALAAAACRDLALFAPGELVSAASTAVESSDARTSVQAGWNAVSSATPSHAIPRDHHRTARAIRRATQRVPLAERAHTEELLARCNERCDGETLAAMHNSVTHLATWQDAEYALGFVSEAEQLISALGSTCAHHSAAAIAALHHLAWWPDAAWSASIRLRETRALDLRRRHSLPAQAMWSVTDLIPVSDESTPPLLRSLSVVRADASTTRGRVTLQRIAGQRRHRQQQVRATVARDVRALFVAAVADCVRVGNEQLLAELIRSASLVEGGGEVRDASMTAAIALWGHVLRPLVTLDRRSPDGVPHFSNTVVMKAVRTTRHHGVRALWNVATPLLNISLHAAREGNYEFALHRACAIVGIVAPSIGTPAATSATPA